METSVGPALLPDSDLCRLQVPALPPPALILLTEVGRQGHGDGHKSGEEHQDVQEDEDQVRDGAS